MIKTSIAVFALLLSSLGAFAQSPVANQGALTAGSWVLPYTSTFDEFVGGVNTTSGAIGMLGWDKTVVVAGTNPVAPVASIAGYSGLITLTTDTTATNGVNITLGHAVGFNFPGVDTNWQSEFVFSPSAITNTGNIKVGFMTLDNAAVIPTTGIYVRFIEGTDASFVVCSDTASTETCTTASATLGVVPVAADYIDVYFYSTATTKIGYKIVDVTSGAGGGGVASVTGTVCPSGCTLTATVPTTIMSPGFQITELGASSADHITVDSFSYASTVVK
jgi:hypothetical protein